MKEPAVVLGLGMCAMPGWGSRTQYHTIVTMALGKILSPRKYPRTNVPCGRRETKPMLKTVIESKCRHRPQTPLLSCIVSKRLCCLYCPHYTRRLTSTSVVTRQRKSNMAYQRVDATAGCLNRALCIRFPYAFNIFILLCTQGKAQT